MDPQGHQLQLILVDSHPRARTALAKRLLGHSQLAVVGQTADPVELHELAHNHRPHVALIDPGGDANAGRVFVQSLAPIADGGPIAVIHVSFFDQDLWSQLEAAGAHELVLKELDVDALSARLCWSVLKMLPRDRWPGILTR
jgi:DNA-binding NarL/FixJ family response regulator